MVNTEHSKYIDDSSYGELEFSLCEKCGASGRIRADSFKERAHSEMKISLIIKGILVTVPISFLLFYFS